MDPNNLPHLFKSWQAFRIVATYPYRYTLVALSSDLAWLLHVHRGINDSDVSLPPAVLRVLMGVRGIDHDTVEVVQVRVGDGSLGQLGIDMLGILLIMAHARCGHYAVLVHGGPSTGLRWGFQVGGTFGWDGFGAGSVFGALGATSLLFHVIY